MNCYLRWVPDQWPNWWVEPSHRNQQKRRRKWIIRVCVSPEINSILKTSRFMRPLPLPSPIKHHAPSAALLKASVQTKQETTWGTLRQGRFPWRQYSDYRTVWLSDGAFFLVNVTICQSLLHSISITLSLTLISVVQFVLTESQKYHPRGSVYSTPYVALPSYFSWQAKLDARFSPTL